MKVELKTKKSGECEYFKINDKEYGVGITALDIQIKPFEPTKIIITAVSDEFILDSEDAKLYLKKNND